MGFKTKITSKGQVTIPKSIREELEIREGDVLEIMRVKDSVCMKKARLGNGEELEKLIAVQLKGLTADEIQQEMILNGFDQSSGIVGEEFI